MIAACPTCGARYRIDTAKLRPEGARLRCSRCESVFRVRAPEAAAAKAPQPAPVAQAPSAAPPAQVPPAAPVAQPAPTVPAPQPEPMVPAPQPAPQQEAAPTAAQAPAPRPEAAAPAEPAAPVPASEPELDRERLVLVAHPETEAGKRLADALGTWGLRTILVHDGVEAILNIQRAQPRVVVLDAALPKMFGFQVCELMKRNESLRRIHVVLVGAIHDQDRYRRPPGELYGADAYIERQELSEGLQALLARFGLSVGSVSPGAESSAGVDVPEAASPVAQRPVPERGQRPETPAADPTLSDFDVSPNEAELSQSGLPPLQALAPPPAAPAREVPAAAQREFEPPEAAAARRTLPPFPAAEQAPESELEIPPAEPELEFPAVEPPLETELDLDLAPPEPEPELDPELALAPPEPAPVVAVPAPPAAEPEPAAAVPAPVAPEPVVAVPEPATPEPVAEVPTPEVPVAASGASAADKALAAEIEQADRLARIIVSDIVLYNPEKFEAGLRSGDVLAALSTELEEGHSLFAQRVDPRVGSPGEFLRRELVRVARSRGMK